MLPYQIFSSTIYEKKKKKGKSHAKLSAPIIQFEVLNESELSYSVLDIQAYFEYII